MSLHPKVFFHQSVPLGDRLFHKRDIPFPPATRIDKKTTGKM